MKTITLNKQQYQIPDNWKSVTINQQQQIEALANEESFIKSLAVYSIYSGIPIDIIKHTKSTDVIKAFANEFNFILNPINSDPINEFEFKGETYHINELFESEFQDYISAKTILLQYKDDKWELLTWLIAILAKKNGETLDDYKLSDRVKLFKELDVETVNRVAAFFLTNQKISNLLSVLSSPQTMKSSLEKKLQDLNNTIEKLEQQRGKHLLIRLWIMILRKYLSYIKKQWEKSLNSLPSKH